MDKNTLDKILEQHRLEVKAAADQLKTVQEDEAMSPEEKFDKMAAILSNLRFTI